jgi:XTP/dITP diphosphohydrolase
MHKIVFVTNNKHKLQEIQHLAQDKIKILSLQDVNFNYEIPETSPTLEGNALEKARFFFSRTGLDCFADDTGLEVEALGGLPGVKSARFASDHDFHKNMMYLLELMKDKQNRKARFRTVIALILNSKEYLFEGIVNGHITSEPLGDNGFGYDPVFIPDGDTRTFAQMSLEEKNNYSHRQKAFTKLINFLLNYLA